MSAGITPTPQQIMVSVRFLADLDAALPSEPKTENERAAALLRAKINGDQARVAQLYDAGLRAILQANDDAISAAADGDPDRLESWLKQRRITVIERAAALWVAPHDDWRNKVRKILLDDYANQEPFMPDSSYMKSLKPKSPTASAATPVAAKPIATAVAAAPVARSARCKVTSCLLVLGALAALGYVFVRYGLKSKS